MLVLLHALELSISAAFLCILYILINFPNLTNWSCSSCFVKILPFHNNNNNNNEFLLENLGIKENECSFIPNYYNDFIRECQKISINSDDKPLLDQDENFYTQINSQYYDISEFNQIS